MTGCWGRGRMWPGGCLLLVRLGLRLIWLWRRLSSGPRTRGTGWRTPRSTCTAGWVSTCRTQCTGTSWRPRATSSRWAAQRRNCGASARCWREPGFPSRIWAGRLPARMCGTAIYAASVAKLYPENTPTQQMEFLAIPLAETQLGEDHTILGTPLYVALARETD